MKRRQSEIEAELLELLGPHRYLAFVEEFGGDRFYVARDPEVANPLLKAAIGDEGVKLFVERFGGDCLMYPLSRKFRAQSYKIQGLTIRQIAKKLGMTVRGVEKLVAKTAAPKLLSYRPIDAAQAFDPPPRRDLPAPDAARRHPSVERKRVTQS